MCRARVPACVPSRARLRSLHRTAPHCTAQHSASSMRELACKLQVCKRELCEPHAQCFSKVDACFDDLLVFVFVCTCALLAAAHHDALCTVLCEQLEQLV